MAAIGHDYIYFFPIKNVPSWPITAIEHLVKFYCGVKCVCWYMVLSLTELSLTVLLSICSGSIKGR